MSRSEAFSAFSSTRWSMVLRLRTGTEQERRTAFGELCQAYWKPVYTFARRLGQSPADAEDMTQGFITQLVEREDLGPVDPEKGRLRTFLKTAFRNYLTDHYRHRAREKRGAGVEVLSLEKMTEDGIEPSAAESPDSLVFDREWAQVVMARAIAAVRENFRERGRGESFAALEPYLNASEEAPSHAETAEKLGQTENAVKVAVHRLRQEFRDALRREVADTLAEGENVDEEIRYLLRACV